MTTRLGYDVTGPREAPVVVLGSSLGTTRAMWDEQVPALAQRFRVVRYDHLGHGESDVPPGPYTISGLAAEVLALLDDRGVARAHLAGVSLGAMVAMQIAATAPERVDRVALICTAAHLPPQSWRDRASTVRSGGVGAVADAVALRWFTPAFAGTERAAQLRDGLRAVPREGYAACCDAVAEMDLRPLLGAVRAPTLVVAGADDTATPPELSKEIAGLLGGPVRLEIVEGAAHLGSVEQSGEVTRLLLRHFESRDE
jgi:3-oxoadipate enol-lactonase